MWCVCNAEVSDRRWEEICFLYPLQALIKSAQCVAGSRPSGAMCCVCKWSACWLVIYKFSLRCLFKVLELTISINFNHFLLCISFKLQALQSLLEWIRMKILIITNLKKCILKMCRWLFHPKVKRNNILYIFLIKWMKPHFVTFKK